LESFDQRPAPAGIGVARGLAAGYVERPFDRFRGRQCASVFLGVSVADLAERHDQAPQASVALINRRSSPALREFTEAGGLSSATRPF
jgi:hypothetical protein